jgi:cbb3-type cytochrome c oxidase subunit III
MKRSVTVAFLVAAVFAVCQFRQAPTYAASSDEHSTNQAAASAISGQAQSADVHSADNVGAKIYEDDCAICHGEKMEGILPAFPPLAGVRRQFSPQQITDLVRHGKGRMPAFTKLKENEMTALLHYFDTSQMISVASISAGSGAASAHSSALSEIGGSLFQQNCAFCHGRQADGGETGPDLTRSKLVAADAGGDKIGEVVRNGRPEKKMPRFNFSEQEVDGLAAFIHSQAAKAATMKGHRRGVDVTDLQTGNVAAGKRYFNGAGNCVSCHAPNGDLAGIASRYEGLELERRMLYPEDAKSKVTVTLSSGEKAAGTLAYLDEFTVAMRDASGTYRSWSLQNVKYSVDSPVNAHVDLFGRYTDADIHNLMAYLQTLR